MSRPARPEPGPAGEFRAHADAEAVAAAARAIVMAAAEEALRERGAFHVALSGGSTPRRTYELLAGEPLDVARTQFWFGDERCVAPSHPDSNQRMAREAWLDRVPVPPANVHGVRGDADPEDAAAAYERELLEGFGLRPGDVPRLDLVLLGMGADGHTASLFPGTTALQEETHLVVATHVAKLDAWRVTMTLPLLTAARRVLFLVLGADKAPLIARARAGDREVPAARVRPAQGELVWLLDRAAAG